MQKKFEINRTKIKGSCQSGIEVVTHDSKSDLPLALPSLCLCLPALDAGSILTLFKYSIQYNMVLEENYKFRSVLFKKICEKKLHNV